MKSINDLFKAARRAGVPLMAIRTTDQKACLTNLCNGMSGNAPKVVWDCAGGLSWRGEEGKAAVMQLCAEQLGGVEPQTVTDPIGMLKAIQFLPARSIVFTFNLPVHFERQDLDAPIVAQAIANLRDPFKATRRSLVMLCPSIKLRQEIAQDVTTFTEELPGPEALGEIADRVSKAASFELTQEQRTRAVKAMQGLNAYAAEDAFAMASEKNVGLDDESLWDRKRDKINSQKGLKVWRGGETFASIKGLSRITEFLGMIVKADIFDAVVWVDEIEKMIASQGSVRGGDPSSSQLGMLLPYLEDNEIPTMCLVGPGGSGKSLIAKAIGGEARVPTISLNLGRTKGEYVGDTERDTEAAFMTIDAISNKRPLFVLTSNGIENMPPELLSRCSLGIWFVDLPTQNEVVDMQTLYSEKYELSDAWPETAGWTGREVRNCARLAAQVKVPLSEAAKNIIPISRMGAEVIRRLRASAHGRYLSAAYPGEYQDDSLQTVPVTTDGLRVVGEED